MAAFPARCMVATCTGLALTGAWVGISSTLSCLAVPAILLPPPNSSTPGSTSSSTKPRPVTGSDHLARQWHNTYDIGAKVGPAVAVASAASFVYALRLLPPPANPSRNLFIAAAVLNVAVAPFTVIVMARTNKELNRRADAAKASKDESLGRKNAEAGSVESYETPELIQWWSFLNSLRGLFQIGAFACVTTALVI